MLNNIKLAFLFFYLLFDLFFRASQKLGQKFAKHFVGFWSVRRQKKSSGIN